MKGKSEPDYKLISETYMQIVQTLTEKLRATEEALRKKEEECADYLKCLNDFRGG